MFDGPNCVLPRLHCFLEVLPITLPRLRIALLLGLFAGLTTGCDSPTPPKEVIDYDQEVIVHGPSQVYPNALRLPGGRNEERQDAGAAGLLSREQVRRRAEAVA